MLVYFVFSIMSSWLMDSIRTFLDVLTSLLVIATGDLMVSHAQHIPNWTYVLPWSSSFSYYLFQCETSSSMQVTWARNLTSIHDSSHFLLSHRQSIMKSCWFWVLNNPQCFPLSSIPMAILSSCQYFPVWFNVTASSLVSQSLFLYPIVNRLQCIHREFSEMLIW